MNFREGLICTALTVRYRPFPVTRDEAQVLAQAICDRLERAALQASVEHSAAHALMLKSLRQLQRRVLNDPTCMDEIIRSIDVHATG